MRQPQQLTEDQRSTITHALRVAAGVFDMDVRNLMANPTSSMGLVLQLRQQSVDSRKLADDINNALEVVVTYD